MRRTMVSARYLASRRASDSARRATLNTSRRIAALLARMKNQ